jgi:hypothetical protein
VLWVCTSLGSTVTVTDPFTGQETTTSNPGHHVVDRTIEVTIKNQPFISYTDADGYEHKLSYSVQFKGHFEDEQSWRPLLGDFQSDSQYTSLTLSYYDIWFIDNNYQIRLNSLPNGSQLDFRVTADIGYRKTLYNTDGWMPVGSTYIPDASSGWSSIQTITVTSESSSSSSSQSQTITLPPSQSTTPNGSNQPQSPDQPQPPDSIFTNPLFMLVVGVLLGGVVVVMVVLFFRRQPKTSTSGVEGLYS